MTTSNDYICPACETADTTERYIHLIAEDLQNFAIFYDPDVDLAYPDLLQYAASILTDLADQIDRIQ